ncbi:MAG: hypothetical protein HY707_04755 [Ignavibacteriae bacterium]|nr:hypothetical protein [Ignavibacteriota bacterium]
MAPNAGAQPPVTSGVTALPKQRYLFIDLYRSAVIFFMLEGHVLRAVLTSEIQQTPIFQLHELFHGLSAPAFLFGAGLTFVISTRKRWGDYHHWGPPLARRIRRLLFVILLGLFLNLPFFSIRKIIIEGTTDTSLQLFQCEVLTCIGIGLLALHGLVFFFKTEARFYGVVIALTAAVCFLTPIVWDIDFLSYTPSFIAQLFNSTHGSPFPLFPFVGFLFAGVLVSWEFLVAMEKQQAHRFIRNLTLFGVIFIASGIMFDALPIRIYRTYDFWYTSPNYFLIRLGALMLLTGGAWYMARKRTRVNPLLTVFGKESLFVYVLHLVVLYGSAANPEMNVQTVLGINLPLLQSIGLFVLFTLVMLLATLVWNYLKEKRFHWYRLIQLTGSAVFLYYFFTRDY